MGRLLRYCPSNVYHLLQVFTMHTTSWGAYRSWRQGKKSVAQVFVGGQPLDRCCTHIHSSVGADRKGPEGEISVASNANRLDRPSNTGWSTTNKERGQQLHQLQAQQHGANKMDTTVAYTELRWAPRRNSNQTATIIAPCHFTGGDAFSYDLCLLRKRPRLGSGAY